MLVRTDRSNWSPSSKMTTPEFADLFGRPARVRACAPGRVNLMGDHTDYNGGFVLPLAIPQSTEVEIAAGERRRVRIWSDQFASDGIVEYELGAERREHSWTDYVQGISQALSASGLERGFDARIRSRVPLGSGLSSSASLEIAVGRALRELYALPIDDIALARAAQRAENDFVGAPVGIMDQMACLVAGERAALFLDTRDLTFRRIRLPDNAAVIVIHSGLSHRHAGGDYATRRRECGDAAALLRVAALRDLTDRDADRIWSLPEPLNRRTHHVLTENARVLATVAAFETGDLAEAGRLFVESHASLRDDYQVSVPEVDRLAEIMTSARGAYGARLTGGGFGGSVVALSDAGEVDRIASAAVEAYRAATGLEARVIVP
jgi:galactokinase